MGREIPPVDPDIYGRGHDAVYGKNAAQQVQKEAQRRLLAMHNLQLLIKKGEFIDYDVYGRCDPRIFGENANLESQRVAEKRLQELQASKRRFGIGISSAAPFLVGRKMKLPPHTLQAEGKQEMHENASPRADQKLAKSRKPSDLGQDHKVEEVTATTKIEPSKNLPKEPCHPKERYERSSRPDTKIADDIDAKTHEETLEQTKDSCEHGDTQPKDVPSSIQGLEVPETSTTNSQNQIQSDASATSGASSTESIHELEQQNKNGAASKDKDAQVARFSAALLPIPLSIPTDLPSGVNTEQQYENDNLSSQCSSEENLPSKQASLASEDDAKPVSFGIKSLISGPRGTTDGLRQVDQNTGSLGEQGSVKTSESDESEVTSLQSRSAQQSEDRESTSSSGPMLSQGVSATRADGDDIEHENTLNIGHKINRIAQTASVLSVRSEQSSLPPEEQRDDESGRSSASSASLAFTATPSSSEVSAGSSSHGASSSRTQSTAGSYHDSQNGSLGSVNGARHVSTSGEEASSRSSLAASESNSESDMYTAESELSEKSLPLSSFGSK